MFYKLCFPGQFPTAILCLCFNPYHLVKAAQWDRVRSRNVLLDIPVLGIPPKSHHWCLQPEKKCAGLIPHSWGWGIISHGVFCRKIWGNHLQTPWEYIIAVLADSSNCWLRSCCSSGSWSSPPPLMVLQWNRGRRQMTVEVRAQSQNYVCRVNTFPSTWPSQLVEAMGASLQVRGKSCYCCCILRIRGALITCTNPLLLSKDAWHQGFALCKIHLCTPNWPLWFSWHKELYHSNLCLKAQPEFSVTIIRKPNGIAHHVILNRARRLLANSVNKWQNLCSCGLVLTLEIYGIFLSRCAVAAVLQLERSWH